MKQFWKLFKRINARECKQYIFYNKVFNVGVKRLHASSYTQDVGTDEKQLKKVFDKNFKNVQEFLPILQPKSDTVLKNKVDKETWCSGLIQVFFTYEHVPNIKLIRVELLWGLRGTALSTRRSGELRSPSPPCGEARGDPIRRSWVCRRRRGASRRPSRSPCVADRRVCRWSCV